MIDPSGDTSGSKDYAAIMDAIESNSATLAPGAFYVSDTVRLGSGQSLDGAGYQSVIIQKNPDIDVLEVAGEFASASRLRTHGGRNGIALNAARRSSLSDVFVFRAAGDGIVLERDVWITDMRHVVIKNCGRHGIYTAPLQGNGNALSITAALIENVAKSGIVYCGRGLSMTGTCVEACGEFGLHIDGMNVLAAGIDVGGCYFEANGKANIGLSGVRGKSVHSVDVHGCSFIQVKAVPSIVFLGNEREIRRVEIGRTNMFSGQDKTPYIDADVCAMSCVLYAKTDAFIRCLNPHDNVIQTA